MSIIQEFKEFAVKGEMSWISQWACGSIGGAFGKISRSMVKRHHHACRELDLGW